MTTTPVAVRCKGCDTYVLACYIHGVAHRLDPVRLNTTGEAFALVLGARTFEVNCLGRDKPFLRTQYHISHGLPELGYIYPEHRCGMNYVHHQYLDERRIFDDQHHDDPPF